MMNAIRNYQQAVYYEGLLGLANWITLQTRDSIVRKLPDFVSEIQSRRDGAPPTGIQYHYCILTEHESIAVGDFMGREGEARTLRDRLAKESSGVTNRNGDRFVQSGKHVLLTLAGIDAAPVFDLVGETNYQPMPDYIARATILAVQGIRNQMIATDIRH